MILHYLTRHIITVSSIFDGGRSEAAAAVEEVNVFVGDVCSAESWPYRREVGSGPDQNRRAVRKSGRLVSQRGEAATKRKKKEPPRTHRVHPRGRGATEGKG